MILNYDGGTIGATVGDFTGTINLIEVHTGSDVLPLLTRGGVKNTVECLVDVGWELYVWVTISNSNPGALLAAPWVVWVTVLCSNGDHGYKEHPAIVANEPEMRYDIQMPVFPATGITISRIKLWANQANLPAAIPVSTW